MNEAMPNVRCEMYHAALFGPDLDAAVAFYTERLGFWKAFRLDDPPMAGVNLGEVQVFLEGGTAYPGGASLYFVVGDADALYAFHRSTGVAIVSEIADRSYGLRDYTVLDLNGYHLSFGHRLDD